MLSTAPWSVASWVWNGARMTGFSRRPDDVARARAYLIAVARRDDDSPLPTYGDVAATYGGIARAAGPVLNTIARDCREAGEPDLSALVVDKASGLPGTFAGMPVDPGSANFAAWRAELVRIARHHWRAQP